MIMNAPQIIMIVIWAIGLTVVALKHGQDQPEYNFWTTLIAVCISCSILIWGGFFK
jgi:hypothetical protein